MSVRKSRPSLRRVSFVPGGLLAFSVARAALGAAPLPAADSAPAESELQVHDRGTASDGSLSLEVEEEQDASDVVVVTASRTARPRSESVVATQVIGPLQIAASGARSVAELLEEAPADAERIFVGKQAGRHCIAQNEINEVLIHYALQGCEVVRLKGGDPFVFGRGGEEAEALADAGIAFEIIPGVTSAAAVPAYAGIPLTHRKFSSSFAVVTGHEASKAQSAVNWSRLATAVDTLVILMGLHKLPEIVAKLIAHGRAPESPAAVIRQGTLAEQEAVIGTLADIVEKSASLKAPALIVVGDVVRLSAKLDWFAGDMVRYHTESSLEEDSTSRL